MCIIDRSETDDREGKSVTRVTLVSKKFVTRVTLASNMTSFCQISGEKERGTPRATRARVEIYQNRKGLVNIM